MSGTLLQQLQLPASLSCRFQPIVCASDPIQIHAVEGLIRGPKGTLFESPQLLFDYVRRVRAEVLIDRECIYRILECAREFPATLQVSINVHASTLTRDSEFSEMLRRRAAMAGVATSRLILELVEHVSSWNQPIFLANLRSLREMGVKIALDDIGQGHSNYRMILDAKPEYFKLDAYICRGVYSDRARRAIVKSVVQLVSELGGQTVVEGIEASDDFRVLRDIGVDFIQGYLFHKPLTASGIMALDYVSAVLMPQSAPRNGLRASSFHQLSMPRLT